MIDDSRIASMTWSSRQSVLVLVVAVAGLTLLGGLLILRNYGDGVTAPATPASAGVGAPDPTVDSAASTLRVAPGGTGDGTGADWRNSASLERLPKLLADAPAGTQVLLRADAGPYRVTKPIMVSGGGTPTQPVIVRGVDGQGRPLRAQLVGDRVDPYVVDGNPGPEAFRVVAGAHDLVFQDLDFKNIGNGCVRVAGDASNLTIRRITAANVRRFIEDDATQGGTATISGMTVHDVTVTGFSRAFARIAYNSHDLVIENVSGDSQGQDGDPFAQGIELGGTVHAVQIRDARMTNAVSTQGPYWNGDGFSAESGTYDIRLERTFAAGNTDAGYDIKSRGATLVDVTAEDNKRNFRLWGDVMVDSCHGVNPRLRGGTGTQDQVHATERAVVTLMNCTFTDGDPRTVVFDVDGTARLTARDTVVTHAPAGRLQMVESGAQLDTPGLRVN